MFPDLRHAFRSLCRTPGFTMVAVLTLALGIGSATAVFSAIYGVLLQPLPFPEADRLVTVRSFPDNLQGQSFPYGFNVSGPDCADWAASNRCFDGLAAAEWRQTTQHGGEEPRQLTALAVTPNYFEVFRASMAAGRPFSPEEAGDRTKVVLGHAYWTEFYQGDPAVIGRTLQLESGPCTIVGVAAAAMDYRQDISPQVYLPLDLAAMEQRANRKLWSFGRLKPGLTLEQARAEMDSLSARQRTTFPDSNRIWGVRVLPLHEVLTGSMQRPLVLLYGAAIAILLLAGVNLAALMLVRACGRQHEIAIRSALGARRLQLFGRLLTESLLLAALGGALGTFIAWQAVDLIGTLAHQLGVGGIVGRTEIDMNCPVLGFALLCTLGATLLLGAVPAFQLSRSPLAAALLAGGRGSTDSRSHQRAMRLLTIVQVALAFVLLVGAGLLTRSLVRLQQASPGFAPAGRFAVQMTRPDSTRAQPNNVRADFVTAVCARLDALPGVADTAAVSILPLTNSNFAQKVVIEGRSLPEGVFMSAELRLVSPNYHRVMGVPVLRGRALASADDGRNPVVVADEIFARRFFGQEDPIGHRLTLNGRSTEIVGIVGPVKDRGPGETEARPHFYLPLAQQCDPQLSFVVRTDLDPAAIGGAIRHAVAEIDPRQPVERITPLGDLLGRTMAPQRLSATLLSTLALFAVLLAMLGIYGVVAYSVARRTREMAIRMALGALRAEVSRNVLLAGAVLASAGLGFGLLGTLALHRFLAAFLFETAPLDPGVLAAALAVLLGTTLLACWLPARRASRVDPLVALRAE